MKCIAAVLLVVSLTFNLLLGSVLSVELHRRDASYTKDYLTKRVMAAESESAYWSNSWRKAGMTGAELAVELEATKTEAAAYRAELSHAVCLDDDSYNHLRFAGQKDEWRLQRSKETGVIFLDHGYPGCSPNSNVLTIEMTTIDR
jgi:hypothetical protein